MSAIDLQSNPAPTLSSVPTTPTGSSSNTTQQPKRSLFGLKKKSTQSLGTSPSSNSLGSATSSLKSGESAESLDRSGSGSSNGGKKRVGVFGRKSKTESGGAIFTNIEGDKDNEGDQGGEKERGEKERGNTARASEDDSSSPMYESDEDM
jgi:hypothetical protein